MLALNATGLSDMLTPHSLQYFYNAGVSLII